jgi:hypothetical protein
MDAAAQDALEALRARWRPAAARQALDRRRQRWQWIFETSGEPYAFEHLDRYTRRRKPERLRPAFLYEYLGHLGVPYDTEPEWPNANVLVRRRAWRRP